MIQNVSQLCLRKITLQILSVFFGISEILKEISVERTHLKITIHTISYNKKNDKSLA